MEGASRQDNYSTLEVDKEKNRDLPVAKEDEADLPQAIDHDAPEVVQKKEAAPAAAARPRKILGLSRKAFWIVLAVVILVIIGAAVGGGVGGSLAHKSKSSQPSGPPQILPGSNIASINYTDTQNITHYRVFFQATTAVIYQSDFDSSTSAWTVSPAQASDNTTALVPMNGTSLSAHIDFHLLFIDSDNTIRELTSNLTSPAWLEGSFRQTLPVVNSSIVSSGKQCAQCSTNNTIIFQGQQNNQNTLNAVNITADATDTIKLIASSVSPVLGSGMGLTQLLPDADNNASTFALYVNAGSLQEVTYNLSSQTWDLQDAMAADGVVASLGAEAHIAAWCTVQGGYRYVKVLSSTSSGGVQLVAWSGAPGQAGWTQSSSVDAFEDVVKNSAIAFNEDGRVYAFGAGEDGAAALTEWAYQEGNTFGRVGMVNTTIV
ncbi:Fungal fucose-specific lectin [Neofusicoccum parvum]|nr:Fungal fucose-specific lectin [Neofusicoccum parvum]